jgi:hypothetical protein
MDGSQVFSSGTYWESRYRSGGASGAGSLGRLARFKAGVINRFIQPIFSAFSAGYRNEFGKTPIYIRATLELSM